MAVSAKAEMKSLGNGVRSTRCESAGRPGGGEVVRGVAEKQVLQTLTRDFRETPECLSSAASALNVELQGD